MYTNLITDEIRQLRLNVVLIILLEFYYFTLLANIDSIGCWFPNLYNSISDWPGFHEWIDVARIQMQLSTALKNCAISVNFLI